jgi:hypothetical protein
MDEVHNWKRDMNERMTKDMRRKEGEKTSIRKMEVRIAFVVHGCRLAIPVVRHRLVDRVGGHLSIGSIDCHRSVTSMSVIVIRQVVVTIVASMKSIVFMVTMSVDQSLFRSVRSMSFGELIVGFFGR